MYMKCSGVYYNGPNKRYARCSRCKAISYEMYEGDKCSKHFNPKNQKLKGEFNDNHNDFNWLLGQES